MTANGDLPEPLKHGVPQCRFRRYLAFQLAFARLARASSKRQTGSLVKLKTWCEEAERVLRLTGRLPGLKQELEVLFC